MTRTLKALGGLMAGAMMPLALGAAEVDGLAAKVGVETILKSEVMSELQRSGLGEADYAMCLDEMIARKLILKAAGESKMTMQEWVVEGRIQDIIRDRFGGDRNKLMAALAREKVLYTEWQDQMKEDMIVQAMRWQMVDKNVTASPAAVRAEYKAHPERYQTGRAVTVSIIALTPNAAPKRGEVEEALKKMTFADVARYYSSDAHAQDGGLWKEVVPADSFGPDVCTAIARLKVGELSDWVEIDGWSFLIRKEGESSGKLRAFAEAYDQIAENVKSELAKAAYDAWIARLRAEAFVKIY